MINSNLIHNILNIAQVVMGALLAGLLATGCVDVAGTLDCSASWIPPMWAGYAIMAMSGLKVVINIFRDGIGGLFKPQPPVK